MGVIVFFFSGLVKPTTKHFQVINSSEVLKSVIFFYIKFVAEYESAINSAC